MYSAQQKRLGTQVRVNICGLVKCVIKKSEIITLFSTFQPIIRKMFEKVVLLKWCLLILVFGFLSNFPWWLPSIYAWVLRFLGLAIEGWWENECKGGNDLFPNNANQTFNSFQDNLVVFFLQKSIDSYFLAHEIKKS